MKIIIQTILHHLQKYPTCGDWQWDGDTLNIYVSEMGNWKYEMLVGLHEATEALICKAKGIKEEDVTNFDLMFEREREEGKHTDGEEPGNDPRACYRTPHKIATMVEKIVAKYLKVNWDQYDEAVMSL